MSRRAAQAATCMLLAALLAPSGAAAIGVERLREKLTAQARSLSSTSGAYVRDLVTGRTLYWRNSATALVPASNEKLLVTAAALLALGPYARQQTTVDALAEPADGVIDGDLALLGAGDPYLSKVKLRRLADQLRALGVRQVRGNVLGDGTLFDARRGSYDSAYAYDGDLGGSLGALVVDRGRGSDPALYAAQVLRRKLLRSGITVRGSARSGSLGARSVTLASVASPPLSVTALRINVPSDNFAAEMLLKTLGATFGTAGSTTAGASFVRATLGDIGVEARLYDGSGLSRANWVSPRELVDLLTEMAATPDAGAALDASLPVAGRTGTVARRMRNGAAAGRCRAKTGTLRGVSALSGYCDTASGNPVAFSFIENGMSESVAKRIEDRMLNLIVRYSRP